MWRKLSPAFLWRAIQDRYRRFPVLLAHPVLTARHILSAVRLRRESGLRLHLGCGERRFDGFLNIDLNVSPAIDYRGNVVDLPCRTGTVERIETYHVIEHLSHRELPEALTSWHRVLRDGGSLVIECPDFDGAVREYLDGNEDRLYNIFGLQRFPGDTHRFGYNVDRLSDLLYKAGFSTVKEAQPVDPHADEEPCLRIEATK